MKSLVEAAKEAGITYRQAWWWVVEKGHVHHVYVSRKTGEPVEHGNSGNTIMLTDESVTQLSSMAELVREGMRVDAAAKRITGGVL